MIIGEFLDANLDSAQNIAAATANRYRGEKQKARPMILCCGEALIDMLPRVTKDGEAAFAPYPGGAVFNTSVALGRLGAPAGFFTGLSNDMFGAQLRDALDDAGVDSHFSPGFDRPTTLAFVRLVDGQATYAFYDENTAGRMLATTDLPDLPGDVQAMFFGGISLVSEPCATTYETLMQREAARRVTMIDPNVRADFITDEQAYRARITRMMALADIIKVSDEDLLWLAGSGDLGDLARGLIGDTAKIVFVTRGSEGASAFTREQEVFHAAQKVDVADTVGAGDTFNAGILAAFETAGLLAHHSVLAAVSADQLTDALRLGVRAAAVTVSRAGANPPWAQEL